MPTVKKPAPARPAPERARPVRPDALARPSADAAPAQPTAPPGAAPSSRRPSTPPATLSAEISPGWRNALAGWLQSHKTYPDEARRRGEEGRALVRFTVDRSGSVLDVELLRGTGSASLDDSVRRMLQDARLPAFPAGMDQPSATVTVTLRYALSP